MVALLSLLGIACALQCSTPSIDFVDFVLPSAMRSWMNAQNGSLVCVLDVNTLVVPADTAFVSVNNSWTTDTPTVLGTSWKEVVATYSTRTFESGMKGPKHDTLVQTFVPVLRLTVGTCNSLKPEYGSYANPSPALWSSDADAPLAVDLATVLSVFILCFNLL